MKGATKTRLMYQAYLSYSQLKEYLTFLEERGLIKLDEETQLYKFKEKGIHYLNIYDEVRDVFVIDNEAEKAKPTEKETPAAVPTTPTSKFNY